MGLSFLFRSLDDIGADSCRSGYARTYPVAREKFAGGVHAERADESEGAGDCLVHAEPAESTEEWHLSGERVADVMGNGVDPGMTARNPARNAATWFREC